MHKILFSALALLSPLSSFAAPSAAEVLTKQWMPLLVRVSPDSDFRIKLLRDGKVVAEEETEKQVSGDWTVSGDTLLISFGVSKKGNQPSVTDLKYSLKLVPNKKVAGGADLLIENKPIVFTLREEMIFDVNAPNLSASLKKKCQQILRNVADASLSKGKELPLAGPEAGAFSRKSEMLHGAYQKNGLNLEASISLVSTKGWDCLFNARFLVDLKKETCGLVSYTENHCAK